MESIAKYILYYNVNTRDLYDASGAFMGNTPFSVYFDNLISVELHYMEDTSSDSISGWVPWTALEGNTVGSSICFDDDYVHTKTGKIYADASVGDTSLIVHVSLDSEVVNPTGVLVVYKDLLNISVPYKGYVENANVYTFELENPLLILLRLDDMVRVPQALLLKIDSDLIDSSRASLGIFSFNVHTLSHKLLNKLIYSGVSKISGVFEHQIVSDGNIVSTFTFDMVVNSLLGYEGQADIPKTGNWADKAYVDSKIITKTSELLNDARFISLETDPVYTADKPNIALKSLLFSKQFSDLLGIPTTIGGYGITDAFIQNRTVTIGNGSILIPLITLQSVKQLLGVDSELGSSVRFLNERGLFTQIQSVMTVNGVSADINGNVQLNILALVNMLEIAGYVKAVKSVNGVLPDLLTLNVTITGDDINVAVFLLTELTLNSFLYGVVTSVNEVTPLEGSITLYASNIPYNDTDVALRLDYILQNMGTGAIKTINGLSPDSDGNIQLSFVKSVDGIAPDSSGDIQLTVTIDGTSMSFYDAFLTLRYRIEQLEQNGGGSGGEYTLTKEAVDSVIGASSTGSTAKFYNEQGAFTTVTGFLPLGGGAIDGDLQLNGTLYTDLSLFVTFRNTLTLGCYSTGGLPIEPDTVSELVLDKPNATARVKLLYTKSESDINEAGLYLDAKSSMYDPSELYVPGFMKIWTGDDTVTVNQIFLRGAFGILIKSNSGINIESGSDYFKFNSKDVAVVDDITAHNESATAHEALFEAKADKTELDLLQPAGTVIAFAGNSAPAGYLICNGAAVSRTTYAKLFAVIGTTYGEGDGSTTFNLPNLTDKFIMGSGTAGTSKTAGLPNITGDLKLRPNNTGYNTFFGFDGVFNMGSSTTITAEAFVVSTGKGTTYIPITFDASRSSSIYGNSSTVQPPALTMRFYIKY